MAARGFSTWNVERGTWNLLPRMKPPPFLLGATLLFWGWQTEFLLGGALMAVLLESALVFKMRWDFSDEDVFGGDRQNQLTAAMDVIFKF